MKASDVKVSDLKDFNACIKAIELIEMDFVNTVGGQKAFFSGYGTEFTASAIKKIAAINAKIDKMFLGCEDE